MMHGLKRSVIAPNERFDDDDDVERMNERTRKKNTFFL